MATGRVTREARLAAKPCRRCGISPKIPGIGQAFCAPCKEFMSGTALERKRERERRRMEEKRRAGGVRRNPNRDAPPGTRWCPGCVEYLSLAMFHSGARSCKECRKSTLRSSSLKYKYGITPGQYDELLVSQGDACAICLRVLKTRHYAVDHNHKTGEVRGLLCSTCNKDILGKSKDDPAMLRRAADYLEQPPARAVIGIVIVPER